MDVSEREELIERLIEADATLFDDGDAISHRDSADAAMRVVESYVEQRLLGAEDALRAVVAAYEQSSVRSRAADAMHKIAADYLANPGGGS